MAVVNPSDKLPRLPSATTDLHAVWAFLEKGLDRIMALVTIQAIPLSHTCFMNLYTASYYYCKPSEEDSTTSSEWSVAGRGSDLYSNLVRYFEQHVRHLRDYSDSLQNELLLKYYAAEWDRYTTGANYINRLFAYLNRYWIRQERDEGRKSVYPIYTLALVQWRANFFLHIQGKQPKLAGAILRLIECQRNGETIDQGLVKKVVDSFVSLGIDERDLNKASLDDYKEHFELHFLAATEAYYKHESESFVAENSVSDYLKKAEGRLKEEEDRVERYLHTTTRKLLITKCENVLVRAHAGLMWENFQSLLDYDKDEDLQRMYSLLSRIPEGLEPLRRKFEERVKRTGLAAVSKLVGIDPAAIEALEPKAYVDALHEVIVKSAEIVNRCFKGDSTFVAILDRACREFVNRNAVTGTSSSISPELLAMHADALLHMNNKMSEDSDLEVALNRVMVVFKYIEEKDVFQIFYSRKLCKRLIYGVSASDEAEASMISKLKEACGFQYTYKFQRMFTDISLSRDLTDTFKERMEQGHNNMGINFNAMVLATNFWPLKPPKSGFVVPADIQLTYDRFQKYFQTRHPDRKLIWLWNYSKNELQTNYLNQKYILMTSTYQMAVLLQYNYNETLSLDELVVATNIGKGLLTQALQPLVKSHILVDETNQYVLNPSFKSKRIRVNLDQPIKDVVKAESTDVLKMVDQDRKYVIQAAIIRIMKARKTMEHLPLIHEVISQISPRFAPQPYDVMKEIDDLLDKGYIERVDTVRDAYNYVPGP